MAKISYIQQRAAGGLDDYAPLASGPGEPDFTLRQLLDILWRRKSIVIATVAVVCLLTLLALLQIKPRYVAEAGVVVETRQERVVKIESVLQGVNHDFYTNETEAAVLRSRSLAGRVVDKLDLTRNPLFNPDLRDVGGKRGSGGDLLSVVLDSIDPANWLPNIAPAWATRLWQGVLPPSGQAGRQLLTLAEQAAWTRDQAIDFLLKRLKVGTSERSRVIDIQLTLEDPVLAARIVNSLVDTYVQSSITAKAEATVRASGFLNDQAAELRRRMEASQRALETYRGEVGIVDLKNQTTLLTQQLAELTTKLITARSQRAEAEARHEQLQRMLSAPGGISSAAAVLQSPLIQKLREQEAVEQRQIAELATQLRDDHPTMVKKRSELKDLDRKINQEIGKIAANQKDELEIARIRERNIAAEVAGLRQQINRQNEAEVKMRALESEVNANRQLYESILTRYKETGVESQGLQQADARVISRAPVPTIPAYPQKALILAVAFVGSSMLGILLVFLAEHLDAGFRSPQQIEALLGLPALGSVPRLPRGFRTASGPAEFVLERPTSVFGEAIRTIRTGLLLSNIDKPPKTVLFTSSLPDEGKTSTAVAMARAAAKAGQRVLIIDCDLRHPSLHTTLGLPNTAGLVELLSAAAPPEDAIQIDAASGLHCLTTGRAAPNPTDLLGSEAMRRLLARLKELYDLVVIDTPPVLVVSDALVLLRSMDKTVYIVRWGKTPREAVEAGVRQVRDASADLAGLVLTQVDMRRQARFRYGNSAYYNGAYRKYYSD